MYPFSSLQEQHVHPYKTPQQGKLSRQWKQFYNQFFWSLEEDGGKEGVSEIELSWERKVTQRSPGGLAATGTVILAPSVPLEAALFKDKQRYIIHLTNT